MADYQLDNAYEIDGPGGAKTLYGKWAETCESSFADGWGFIAQRLIAELYLAVGGGGTPILVIGAGKGQVAEHPKSALTDTFDITPEMLDVTGEKNLYSNLIEGDLLQPLDLADNSYGSVISCGTFTHGHVGPACLPELIRVTRPDGFFVCGTIPAVLDGMGFGSVLARLQAANQITPLRFADVPIYDNPDHPQAQDRGLVMIFRKC
jgi:SAM-dependent methyltransferase